MRLAELLLDDADGACELGLCLAVLMLLVVQLRHRVEHLGHLAMLGSEVVLEDVERVLATAEQHCGAGQQQIPSGTRSEHAIGASTRTTSMP